MYTCLKGAVSTPLDFLKIGEKISIAHTTFSYIFLGLRMVVTRYHNSWLRNTCNMTIENNVNINKEQSKSICTFYVSRNTNRMFFVQNSLPYKVCIKGWQQKLLKPHFSSNCYRLLNTPVGLPLFNLQCYKNTHYDPLSCNFREKNNTLSKLDWQMLTRW